MKNDKCESVTHSVCRLVRPENAPTLMVPIALSCIQLAIARSINFKNAQASKFHNTETKPHLQNSQVGQSREGVVDERYEPVLV
jgi:hypothetical protein